MRSTDGVLLSQFGSGDADVFMGLAADGSVFFLLTEDYTHWENGDFQTWTADGQQLPTIDRSELETWFLQAGGDHRGADFIKCRNEIDSPLLIADDQQILAYTFD